MKLSKEKKLNANQFENFPSIGGLMVSKMVTEEKQKVQFLYRERPTSDEDSGWRIFSGSEDQDFVDNPDNIAIYNATTILEIDPSIADLLLNPVGSVFERESAKSKWYEVDDFEFEDDYLEIQNIDEDWTIEINKLFMPHKDDNGDFIFVMKGKTVRIAFWEYVDKSKKELFEYQKSNLQSRDEKDSPTLETFELSDKEVSRIGYMIQEADENKSYKVIHGYSIVDKVIVQIALYFDNEDEKDWALETWTSIKRK